MSTFNIPPTVRRPVWSQTNRFATNVEVAVFSTYTSLFIKNPRSTDALPIGHVKVPELCLTTSHNLLNVLSVAVMVINHGGHCVVLVEQYTNPVSVSLFK